MTDKGKPKETGTNKVSIEFYGLTDEQVASIKQAFDSLKPDDSFIASPDSLLTIDEWIAFKREYQEKHISDPRRARPI